MHVIRHLSPLLYLLLLGSPLVLSLEEKSLSEQLLGAARRLDVDQTRVRVLDHALAESAQAELYHGPIVQDLTVKSQELTLSKLQEGKECAADIELQR